MFVYFAMGAVAGVLGILPFWLTRTLTRLGWDIEWSHATWVLAVTALAFVLQKFVLDRKRGSARYDGIADLYLHVHSAGATDSSARWAIRGSISFLLGLFGGKASPEGAVIEWTHALFQRFRKKSARWFEQRRRTDASASIAAGVAAAFGAPVAAVLLGQEMGFGGRTLSVAATALAAFTVREILSIQTGIDLVLLPNTVPVWSRGLPFWLVAVALGSGLLVALWIRFYRYSQDSLIDLFQTQMWMRVLTAGTLLFLICIVAPYWSLSPHLILRHALLGHYTAEQSLIGLLVQALSLALLLSGFGTTGALGGLLLLGGLGAGILVSLGAPQGMVLVGAGTVLAAALGAPLSSAVLVYEFSQNDFSDRVLLALLTGVAAMGAIRIRKFFKVSTLAEADLVPRGLTLRDGRMANVLDALLVRDAMVTDFEAVHEQEPLTDLRSRLIKSKYPFFPVVNGSGQFSGFLTADLIQSNWNRGESLSRKAPLSRLMEVRDLLYRSGFKAPVVKVHDRLMATSGIFDDLPCVPVVAEDGRVQGLLFAHSVRLAYERELARRSLAWERPKDSI